MASVALTSLVKAHAPRRPYCGVAKNGARVRPQAVALEKPYIQLNSPAHVAWLLLDIDKPESALAWERAHLPPPTYVAINCENGHAHIGYALSAPVCVTDAARLGPLRYLAAIESAYISKIGADVSFSGPLTKNPLHPHWKLWEPANAPTYELSYLAEFVDLPAKLSPRPIGLGRNCDLFDFLRVWAYHAVRAFWRPGGEAKWYEAVRRQAEVLNTFDGPSGPLGTAEVAGIARSVARFVWRRFTPEGFREVQASRGRLGAAASAQVKRNRREQAVREAIAQLSVEGKAPSMRAVSQTIGCSVSTLSEGYRNLWS